MLRFTRHGAISAGAVGFLLVGATGCPLGPFSSDSGSGAKYDFNGTWSGGQSDGENLTGPLKFTITGGVVTGDIGPLSGSTRLMAGTESSSGAFTATVQAAPNGCTVNFAGQVTETSATTASASGTYALVPSVSCAHNTGTWSASKP